MLTVLRSLNTVIVKELDITEFRGIRKLVKPLELGGFNVLIGRNNVGKTAILEALYMLAMPYATTIPPYGKEVREFIATSHGGPSSLIYGYAGNAVLKYGLKEATRIGFTEVPTSSAKEIFVKKVEVKIARHSIVKVLFNSREANYNDYLEFLKSLNASLERDIIALYIPNNSEAYAKLHSYVMRDEVLSWIEKEGLHRRVVRAIIAPTVYDKFTEVTLKKNRLCVRKEVSEDIGPLYVDIDSLGEGVKRILLTYLAVEYFRPKILLWDDLEVAAHPSLLESTLKWLASSGRQVIISTHSLDVLHSLTLVKPKDCKIIVLKKSSEDIVDYHILTLDEVEELLGSGIDVRKIVEELKL